jgi:hypothetical protein
MQAVGASRRIAPTASDAARNLQCVTESISDRWDDQREHEVKEFLRA